MSLEHTRVDLPGTANVRDLGGYPVAGGRAIVPGRLFRGELLAHPGASARHSVWVEAEADTFRALGIRTVVDLRSSREAELTPSAWSAATGADAVALPIEEGGEGSDTNYIRDLIEGRRPGFGVDDLIGFYVDTLDRRGATFGAATRLLADPDRLPLLVHCAAGKDRTGLFVALLLETLGAPRELVVEDCALTGVLRPERWRAYADLFAGSAISAQEVRALFDTPAAAMDAVLAHVDSTYGGAADYLRERGGVSGADLDAAAANLTRP